MADNTEDKYCYLCKKCMGKSIDLGTLLNHLVRAHPTPNVWLSQKAARLTGNAAETPYSTVTEVKKKRKIKDATGIPRPLNSFMIFSHHMRKMLSNIVPDVPHPDVSRRLGKLWRFVSDDIKSRYSEEASKLSLIHGKEYPKYKYKPRKKLVQTEDGCNDSNWDPSSDSYSGNTNCPSDASSDFTVSSENIPPTTEARNSSVLYITHPAFLPETKPVINTASIMMPANSKHFARHYGNSSSGSSRDVISDQQQSSTISLITLPKKVKPVKIIRLVPLQPLSLNTSINVKKEPAVVKSPLLTQVNFYQNGLTLDSSLDMMDIMDTRPTESTQIYPELSSFTSPMGKYSMSNGDLSLF